MSRTLVDSGITYLKKIPDDWKIYRIKDGFNCNKELVGDSWNTTQLLSLTTSGIKEKDIENPNGKLPESFETYQFVNKNNIVMCLFDLDCSAVFSGISNYEGMISPAYKVLECKKNMMEPRYAGYYFNYISYDRKYMHYSKNIRFTLNYDEFSSLPMLYPPVEEQKRIADYLDSKCSKIDQVIEDNNKAIELLEEYRKSVISKSVFCGVNKTCSQKKDSINFGSIPNNWEDINMRAIFNFKKGLSITKENLVENGIPVISYGQIHSKTNDGTKVKKELIRYVPDTYLESDPKALTHNGDIIFADTSEDLEGSGNSVFIDTNYPIFAGYHTIIASPKTEITKYFAYLFQTDKWRSQVRSSVYGVKLFSITQKILKGCNILVPSLDEQKEIADYLDRMCSNVDKVIDYRKKIIEKLEEYKKSLIYEVVTGKKEV